MSFSLDIHPLRHIFGNSHRRYLIVTHRDPDFDAIGSALAVHLQLRRLGRDSRVWIADTLEQLYRFLPASSEIQSVVPSADTFDTIIAVDCSQWSRIRNIDALSFDRKKVTIVNIDHHNDNGRFGDINCVEHISSVGEFLYFIFRELRWPISKEVANCLYAAITFDTGRFLYKSVTPHTFEAAAALVRHGADSYDIGQRIYENLSLNTFELIKTALDRLIVNNSFGYAYTTIPLTAPRAPFKVVDFIRQLSEVPVFLVFQESENNEVKVNLRSKNDFDVSQFAAQFGGGGHINASGITISGSLTDVEQKVIAKLQTVLKANKKPV